MSNEIPHGEVPKEWFELYLSTPGWASVEFVLEVPFMLRM